MPTDAPLAADTRYALDLLARTDHGHLAATRRALPVLAGARHVVVGDRLLLRLHGDNGTCAGQIVAYGTGDADHWSAQVIGVCTPADPEEARHTPLAADAPDGSLYLWVTPQFATVQAEEAGGTRAE